MKNYLFTAGFNFVCCSHYLQSPVFISACDELGILGIDVPKSEEVFASAFRLFLEQHEPEKVFEI